MKAAAKKSDFRQNPWISALKPWQVVIFLELDVAQVQYQYFKKTNFDFANFIFLEIFRSKQKIIHGFRWIFLCNLHREFQSKSWISKNYFLFRSKKFRKIKISKYKFVFCKLLVLNLCVTIFQVPTPNRSLFVQLSVLDPLDFCDSDLRFGMMTQDR